MKLTSWTAAVLEEASYFATTISLPGPTGREVKALAASESGPSRMAAMASVFGRDAYAESNPFPMPDFEPVIRTLEVKDMLKFAKRVLTGVEIWDGGSFLMFA